MRFALFSLIVALLAAYAMAVAPLRAVIVSYPNDAPQSLVDEACEAIEKAGGVITHKYNIIKGFAAHAPASVLEKVQALSDAFTAMIEEDGVVTTQEKDHGKE